CIGKYNGSNVATFQYGRLIEANPALFGNECFADFAAIRCQVNQRADFFGSNGVGNVYAVCPQCSVGTPIEMKSASFIVEGVTTTIIACVAGNFPCDGSVHRPGVE